MNLHNELEMLKRYLSELDVPNNHPIRYASDYTCLSCKFLHKQHPDDTKGKCIRYSRWSDQGFVCDKYVRGAITDIKDSDIEEINAISGINSESYEAIFDKASRIKKEIEKGYQKHFKLIWKCCCHDELTNKHTEIFHSMKDVVKRSKYLRRHGISQHNIHVLSSVGHRKEEKEESEERKNET